VLKLKISFHKFVVPVALAVLLQACVGEELADVEVPSAGEGDAVMLSVFARTPDGSNLYVGVYPDLPSEAPDQSRMLEVAGTSRAQAFEGHVYVWKDEEATYTRYEVDGERSLHPTGSLSFLQLGVTGNVQTIFVSSRLAQTMTDSLDVISWDPSTMEIRHVTTPDALEDPDYPRVEYGEPELFGDFVAWPVLWSDYDNFRFKPEVGVVLTALEGDAAAKVVRDRRCGAGWELFVDDAGDLYVTGTGYFGFAHFFGDDPSSYPNDCVLRIRSGEVAFDAEYYLDLSETTSSPAVYHTWQVNDRTLLAAVWDPEEEAPETDDAYWSAPLLRKLVLIEEGESRSFAEIPKSAVWSTVDHRLDGVLYMLSSEGLVDAEGPSDARSTLYEITESGAREVLSLPGEFWGMGRVR
jgi:Domain of unknown function (DUF4374)